jgi:hypothetical protein
MTQPQLNITEEYNSQSYSVSNKCIFFRYHCILILLTVAGSTILFTKLNFTINPIFPAAPIIYFFGYFISIIYFFGSEKGNFIITIWKDEEYVSCIL